MNPAIFRRLDIRGIVGADWKAFDAKLIAQAFVTNFFAEGHPSIAVGHDNRLSSATFFEAVCTGLTEAGAKVLELGLVATPILYFAPIHLNLDGGIMVTASHNPPEWNGLKLVGPQGTLSGNEIYSLHQTIQSGKFKEGHGKREAYEIVPDYLSTLKAKFSLLASAKKRKLKVIVDAGNGVGGLFLPGILEELGHEVIGLDCEPDGTFPHHIPNPALGINVRDSWQMMGKDGADVALLLDGDCDRLNAIDEKQTVLWGDGLTILFAREILAENPGAEILYDVTSSPAVPEDILAHGGKPTITPTGHSLIRKIMQERNILFAGEYSEHLFFADRYYGFDDAIYAALRLIARLVQTGEPLSVLMEKVPPYKGTGQLLIPCPDEIKNEVVEEVTSHLASDYRIDRTDGCRVQFDEKSLGLLRASNTMPRLELMVWSKIEANLLNLRKLLLSLTIEEIKKRLR